MLEEIRLKQCISVPASLFLQRLALQCDAATWYSTNQVMKQATEWEEMAGTQQPKLGNILSQSAGGRVNQYLEKQPGEAYFETLSLGGKWKKAGLLDCVERKLTLSSQSEQGKMFSETGRI